VFRLATYAMWWINISLGAQEIAGENRRVLSHDKICLRSSGRRRGRSLVGSARTKLELGQPYWLQFGEARFAGEKAPLALDVTFPDLYVLNRNALVKKNG
jgi:hypothetical protein